MMTIIRILDQLVINQCSILDIVDQYQFIYVIEEVHILNIFSTSVRISDCMCIVPMSIKTFSFLIFSVKIGVDK